MSQNAEFQQQLQECLARVPTSPTSKEVAEWLVDGRDPVAAVLRHRAQEELDGKQTPLLVPILRDGPFRTWRQVIDPTGAAQQLWTRLKEIRSQLQLVKLDEINRQRTVDFEAMCEREKAEAINESEKAAARREFQLTFEESAEGWAHEMAELVYLDGNIASPFRAIGAFPPVSPEECPPMRIPGRDDPQPEYNVPVLGDRLAAFAMARLRYAVEHSQYLAPIGRVDVTKHDLDQRLRSVANLIWQPSDAVERQSAATLLQLCLAGELDADCCTKLLAKTPIPYEERWGAELRSLLVVAPDEADDRVRIAVTALKWLLVQMSPEKPSGKNMTRLMSMAEIATALECDERTAKKRLGNALSKVEGEHQWWTVDYDAAVPNQIHVKHLREYLEKHPRRSVKSRRKLAT